MNLLIFLRHAEASAGRLTDKGRAQLPAIGARLKQMTADGIVRLLSSAAPRALESAAPLAEALGVVVEPHHVLWCDDEHDPDPEQALEVIQSACAEAQYVVVVTHATYMNKLASDYASRQDWERVSVTATSRKVGEGIVVDPSRCVVENLQL